MSANESAYTDQSEEAYRQKRTSHWDRVAERVKRGAGWGGLYYRRMAEMYRFLVAPGQRVLELGCGRGDLLAAVSPSRGVGVDFSEEMIALGREAHPELTLLHQDVHELDVDSVFDVIILSGLVNDLWDVQAVFERLRPLTHPDTRIIVSFFSRLWELPLRAAAAIGLASPKLHQNWLTTGDVAVLLELSGFEPIRQLQEVLCPLPLPLLHRFCNRFLVKTWPWRCLALQNVMIARPQAGPREDEKAPLVSVVVAARNEEGNIRSIFERVPRMGGGTELIFVEGNSTDDTYGEVERQMKEFPEQRCKLFRQPGVGKGDAVRKGFAEADGDILMILDADLTVPPEDLPRFYDALVQGKGEFINGVRLVYPMEERAMRFFNLLGNKFFSWVFSWLLGQPVKDSLCGTKVLRKKDYDRIAANRAYFGDFDPFGDFDLLFGAAKQNMKIIDLPIRYRERTYGDTNISRWRHGLLLLRMVAFAARRIKFV